MYDIKLLLTGENCSGLQQFLLLPNPAQGAVNSLVDHDLFLRRSMAGLFWFLQT